MSQSKETGPLFNPKIIPPYTSPLHQHLTSTPTQLQYSNSVLKLKGLQTHTVYKEEYLRESKGSKEGRNKDIRAIASLWHPQLQQMLNTTKLLARLTGNLMLKFYLLWLLLPDTSYLALEKKKITRHAKMQVRKLKHNN